MKAIVHLEVFSLEFSAEFRIQAILARSVEETPERCPYTLGAEDHQNAGDPT
jgi:hypothetical protein